VIDADSSLLYFLSKVMVLDVSKTIIALPFYLPLQGCNLGIKIKDIFSNTHHGCLWVAISFSQAFGRNMLMIVHPQAQFLQVQDPRVLAYFAN
jgi:hypothetical protein